MTFAAGETMDFGTVITAVFTNGIGAACAMAVLWLAWYRETKTIPAMMAGFNASHERALAVFSEITKEERMTCQRWHENNLQQHKENREAAERIFAEFKENRHLLYNLLHTLDLQKAVRENTIAQQRNDLPK